MVDSEGLCPRCYILQYPGAVDVIPGNCYTMILVSNSSAKLENKGTRIATLYEYGLGAEEPMIYVGMYCDDGTYEVFSDAGEGKACADEFYTLAEVPLSYYYFSPYLIGREKCYASWPIKNLQIALVMWRSTLPKDTKVPEYTFEDADGIWGGDTKTMVIAFQQAHGLDADGVVGNCTKGELLLYYLRYANAYAP